MAELRENALRVLVLTDLYPTARSTQGGSFVRDRVEALERCGVVVETLSLRMVPTWLLRAALRRTGRDPSDFAASSFGDATYKLRLHEYVFGLRRGPIKWLVSRVADSVCRAIEGREFDVIHAHGMYRAKAGAVAREVSHRLDIPYVLTLHGSDVTVNIRRNPGAFIPVLYGAGAVIYVSKDLQRKAISYGAPKNNAWDVPNGVDTTLFAREETGEGPPTIAYVGGLEWVKGADRLPEVFRRVHEARPDVIFEVVGSGTLKAEMERKLGGLPVTFHGHLGRQQVAAVMSRTDVLLVPSRSEGWGCVVLEAHASGARTVATRVGGLVESVGDDRFLVPEYEGAQGLAERTIWALAQDGEGIRERAQRFSWESLVVQEIAIYSKVIASKKAR